MPITQNILLATLVCSSVGATFVNKYVLSVLKFTYPTVYQSWQTGVTAAILLSLSAFGLIQFAVIDRQSSKHWIPAMCFFTVGIYSGSKALSRLPIPIFFTMLHLVHVSIAFVDEIYFRKHNSPLSLFGAILGLVGLAVTIKSDTEFDVLGYKWMVVHCLCSASYSIFAKKVFKSSLREIDKIMLNSLFSVIVLMGFGTYTGEVGRSLNFPFIYYKKFHAGCITSGISGALLGLSYSRLAEVMPVSKIRWISTLAMVLTSALSLFIFQFTLSVPLVLGITVGLLGSVIYTYSNYANTDIGTDSRKDEDVLPNERIA
ncbi:UDP-N-acetylglucosamine transporter TMEM241 homolog [Rhopilema esculentum]|uniref:UDP-N-acetylglucosamine transporter TMEM241 homolog n=1 Tax=Rhopilema esculentum TaxID=499914 RepID=UPI0031D6B5F9